MATSWVASTQRQRARLTVLVVALVTWLVAVPSSASGSTNINLLGPNGNATIVYDGAFTGVIGTGVTDPLDGIYNSDLLPSLTPVGPSGVTCSSFWRWEQIFCDLPPTTDDASTVTKLNRNVGITFYNDADLNWYGYYVVDLGSVYSLGNLQVFQMFSDGKVTHVSMEGHPQTGDARPAVTDASWFATLPKSPVSAGREESGPPNTITEPTSFTLGGVSTRYVLLKFWNDGTLGHPWYIEVGGIKLFGGTSPSWDGQGPPPWLQSHGRAAGSTCPTGWHASWAEWAVPQTGGWVCNRTIHWNGSTWVQNPDAVWGVTDVSKNAPWDGT